MRAVRRSERIVHIHITQFAQALAEALIASLFLGMEAQVLQNQYFAGLQRSGLRFCIGPNAVGGKNNGHTKQGAKVFGHGPQAHGRVHFALGAAQVAHEDGVAAVLDDLLHGGHDGPGAGIVRHVSIRVLGYVEVYADKGFLACEGIGVHGQHGAKIPATGHWPLAAGRLKQDRPAARSYLPRAHSRRL